jgi:hypothetical protein
MGPANAKPRTGQRPAVTNRAVRQDPSSAGCGAEEGCLAPITDPGRGQIFVEKLLEFVMRGHLVALAALLVQPHPPALAVRKIVLDSMATTALMRAKLHTMTPISARSAQAHEPRHFRFRAVG